MTLSAPVRCFYNWLFCLLLLVSGRLAAQSAEINPQLRVYSVAQLQRDFGLMRLALEEAHPGLYRYHPRDSINRWLDEAVAQLTQPMTELQFRRVVEPAVDRIGCGHTDLYASKALSKYRKKHPFRPFPVDVFVADQKLYIRENRSTDSTVRRGSELLSVNGRPAGALLHQFYQYMSSDGYNQTFKPYILNTGLFGTYYALAIGPDSAAQQLVLRDLSGTIRTVSVRTRSDKIRAESDSVAKRVIPKSSPRMPKPPKKADQKDAEARTLTFPTRDSSLAIMDIRSFTGGGQRAFFRRSFRDIAGRKEVNKLVVDVRGNLGGSSGASLKLASYLIDKPFQAYSQVDAPVRQVSFNRYLGWKFWRFWIRHFFVWKTPEGTFRRIGTTGLLKPTARNGFRGDVFVLTNGGTFSAAAIFASLMKHYATDRVTVVGRETGGGEYGCNAFTSPYMTLPETGVQLRLPLYRIVLAIPGVDKGHGVMPDVPVTYTPTAILTTQDLDLEKVYELVGKPARKAAD